MRNSKTRFKVLVAATFMIALSLVLTSCSKEDVIAYNVWAFGIPLGGLSKEEALTAVKERLEEIGKSPLVFQAGEVSYEVPLYELRVSSDTSGLADKISEPIDSRWTLMPDFTYRKGDKVLLAALPSLESDDLEETVMKIAENLCRDASPERYGFSDHDLVILPAENGQVVTYEDVIHALEVLQGNVVEVPFKEIEAPQSSELEPLSLIASHETEYDLSETDRNVNLALAAKAVHGQVLMPGETYSFNEAAGERSEARGYRYADVVVGNSLVPDIGGGICQVTTTLFNAAAKSGLSFPEVHAHGIPVEYAEPGTDAAVAWDYLDLEVKNNTDGPIVFGAWVEDGKVTVKVFGKPQDYTYELEPVTLETYPAEGMEPGLLVETYLLKKQDGEVLERRFIYKSRYEPTYPK